MILKKVTILLAILYSVSGQGIPFSYSIKSIFNFKIGFARGVAGIQPPENHSRFYHLARYGRSIVDFDDMFLKASQDDANDCAKKLICSLSAQNPSTLAEDEAIIASIFGQGDIDVSKSTVEFDLAAIMGRKAGEAQCKKIYSRCDYPLSTLMEAMRQPDLDKI